MGQQELVEVLFRAVGEAPALQMSKQKVDGKKPFSFIIDWLRRKLPDTSGQNLFLYICNAFCPSPDEEVGVLSQAYGTNGVLIISYAVKPVWG